MNPCHIFSKIQRINATLQKCKQDRKLPKKNNKQKITDDIVWTSWRSPWHSLGENIANICNDDQRIIYNILLEFFLFFKKKKKLIYRS